LSVVRSQSHLHSLKFIRFKLRSVVRLETSDPFQRTTTKKLSYQWCFSYLTGFTGSIGFSFLFLSFLLPAIASSSEAGGEETEKEESRYAGEIKTGLCIFYGVP